MALTPEDVLNKTFGTTQFRRGYDEREVDDFLDEIVATLRRVNKDLEDCRAGAPSGPSDVASVAPLVDTSQWQERIDREVAARVAAEKALVDQEERHRVATQERVAAAASVGDAEIAGNNQRRADLDLSAQEAEQATQARAEAAAASAAEAESAAQERIDAAMAREIGRAACRERV